MPARSAISNISLKRLRLTILFLLLPLLFFAQSLSGLYTGVLTNDSNSVRKDQSFEIALTEYRGKVYGYSRSEFIVNDTLYYIVKRVKGTIDGDVCEVTDDEIIACNFLKRRDKGVKVTSTFYRNKQDSTWYLAGKWNTNQTKKYYTVTGKISLKEEKDLNASKLFPHLEELNLANDVAFYKDRKAAPVVMRTVEPENKRFESLIKTEEQTTRESAPVSTLPDASTVSVKTVQVSSPQFTPATKPEKKETTPTIVKTDPVITKTEPKQEPVIQKTNVKVEQQATKDAAAVSTKPDTKTVAVATIPVTTKPVEIKKPETTPPAKTEVATSLNNPDTKKPVSVVTAPVNTNEVIEGRKSEFSQVVNFASDSLELALYDNGEVDGDTVSVFMDGEPILSRQCLKVSAIKKTIHLAPGQEEFSLVLFADNLGKYPPNTGLLVVHDGDDVYNIRFSADFQKNAGVVFKRKKK